MIYFHIKIRLILSTLKSIEQEIDYIKLAFTQFQN